MNKITVLTFITLLASIVNIYADMEPIFKEPRFLFGKLDYYGEIWRKNMVSYTYYLNLSEEETLKIVTKEMGDEWTFSREELPKGDQFMITFEAQNRSYPNLDISMLYMKLPEKDRGVITGEYFFNINVVYK